MDKWLYFIKHLEDFQSIPIIFKNEVVFNQAFEKAELAKYNVAEWESYERSLKEFRDLKGIVDTAFDSGKTEGKIEGRAEGKAEGKEEGIAEATSKLAKKLKLKGFPPKDIADLTGLPESDIAKL